MVGQDVAIDPRLVTKVNVLGMSNAFEAARIMGVKRVVYASSETVYGPQAMYGMRDVTEDDQTNPTHSYAVCKKYAEILAGDYSRQFGMSFTGLRPTIGYGHGGRSPAQYWSDLPSNCAVGKPFAMEGDGKGLCSLVSEGKTGLPWLVSDQRAKKDFGFTCMPLEKAVLLHINDARLEAGMQPIKCKLLF
jgi:nucleoside-diphosphate-sugar epimerase